MYVTSDMFQKLFSGCTVEPAAGSQVGTGQLISALPEPDGGKPNMQGRNVATCFHHS